MSIHQLLKELKKDIIKNFGKRCEDFSPLCACCQAWHGYDTLEILYDYDVDFGKTK